MVNGPLYLEQDIERIRREAETALTGEYRRNQGTDAGLGGLSLFASGVATYVFVQLQRNFHANQATEQELYGRVQEQLQTATAMPTRENIQNVRETMQQWGEYTQDPRVSQAQNTLDGILLLFTPKDREEVASVTNTLSAMQTDCQITQSLHEYDALGVNYISYALPIAAGILLGYAITRASSMIHRRKARKTTHPLPA
jgi:hypothetical protein